MHPLPPTGRPRHARPALAAAALAVLLLSACAPFGLPAESPTPSPTASAPAEQPESPSGPMRPGAFPVPCGDLVPDGLLGGVVPAVVPAGSIDIAPELDQVAVAQGGGISCRWEDPDQDPERPGGLSISVLPPAEGERDPAPPIAGCDRLNGGAGCLDGRVVDGVLVEVAIGGPGVDAALTRGIVDEAAAAVEREGPLVAPEIGLDARTARVCADAGLDALRMAFGADVELAGIDGDPSARTIALDRLGGGMCPWSLGASGRIVTTAVPGAAWLLDARIGAPRTSAERGLESETEIDGADLATIACVPDACRALVSVGDAAIQVDVERKGLDAAAMRERVAAYLAALAA